MSQYVTLRKSDPLFQSYLLGTFSKTERAKPIKSSDIGSDAEEVTFQIIKKQDVQRPSKFVFYLLTFRLSNLVFVLFPFLLVSVKNLIDHHQSDIVTALLACIGVAFGFIAAQLRNDYLDHLKGFDRMFDKAGSRAIQKAWITAAEVRRWSYFFLVVSLLFAVPVLLQRPEVGIIVATGVLLTLWAQFNRKTSFKYHVGGEFLLFLLLGPLLFLGYQLSFGIPMDLEVLLLGGVWGWLLVGLIHLKNFAQIFDLTQARFTNTINWLGFDQARGFIALWWLSFIVLFYAYHHVYAGKYWGWYLSLSLLFFSTRFFIKLKSLRSPMGSDIHKVQIIGRRLFLITVAVWTFESLWYFLTWNP